MTICGRTDTRSGNPCQIKLRGGKCCTHDSDLKKRNRKVARSFKNNNPTAFASQRSAAGRRGFQAAVKSGGFEQTNQKARYYRIQHPSEPERWMIQLLGELAAPAYEREYDVGKGQSADFAWPARRHRAIIEVNGHQDKPSFGESLPRLERQMKKIDRLRDEGWLVLVVNARADRCLEAISVKNFLEHTGVLSGDAEEVSEPEASEEEVEITLFH